MKIIRDFLLLAVVQRLFAGYITDLLKKYLINPIAKWFLYSFIHTEKELAIWMHYKNKSLDSGHDDHELGVCADGLCARIARKA